MLVRSREIPPRAVLVAPELEYFKAINSIGPAQDPQILFLLMAQYSSANLQNDGVNSSRGACRNSDLACRILKSLCI